MTKKQAEEMERLATYCYAEDLLFKCNSDIARFKLGYKAAQEPDQLILNDYVRGLIEALEIISQQPQSVDPNFKSWECAFDALKPFRNIKK